MNVGQVCSNCKKGKIRPFQFSFSQAIIRCDNLECDVSLFSPWNNVITRDLKVQVSSSRSDVRHGTSGSSSGVNSESNSCVRSSPTQSCTSGTDKEVERFLRRTYNATTKRRNKKNMLHYMGNKVQDYISNTNKPERSSVPPSPINTTSASEFFNLLDKLNMDSTNCSSFSQENVDTSTNSTEVDSWLNSLCNDSESPKALPDLAQKFDTKSLDKGSLLNNSDNLCFGHKSAFTKVVSPKKVNSLTEEGLYNSCHNLNGSSYCDNKFEKFKNDEVNILDSHFLSPAGSGISEDSGFNDDLNRISDLGKSTIFGERSKSPYKCIKEKKKLKKSEIDSLHSSPLDVIQNLVKPNFDLIGNLVQSMEYNVNPVIVTDVKSASTSEDNNENNEDTQLKSPEDDTSLSNNEVLDVTTIPCTSKTELLEFHNCDSVPASRSESNSMSRSNSPAVLEESDNSSSSRNSPSIYSAHPTDVESNSVAQLESIDRVTGLDCPVSEDLDSRNSYDFYQSKPKGRPKLATFPLINELQSSYRDSKGKGRGGRNKTKDKLNNPSRYLPKKKKGSPIKAIRKSSRTRVSSLEVKAPSPSQDSYDSYTHSEHSGSDSIDSYSDNVRKRLKSLIPTPGWELGRTPSTSSLHRNISKPHQAFNGILSGTRLLVL